MKKGKYISLILRAKQTVFTFQDIAMLWRDASQAARVRINYYIKSGEIYPIRRGIYAKDKNYDKLELAVKIYSPAYVGLETVLAQAGLIFQYYSRIFVVSYLSREIKCDGQIYDFRKIKNSVLANKQGVENRNNLAIAAKERAFLDVLYLNKNYHFDNLRPLDWKRVFEILPIYQNKKMEERVKKLYKEFLKQ